MAGTRSDFFGDTVVDDYVNSLRRNVSGNPETEQWEYTDSPYYNRQTDDIANYDVRNRIFSGVMADPALAERYNKSYTGAGQSTSGRGYYDTATREGQGGNGLGEYLGVLGLFGGMALGAGWLSGLEGFGMSGAGALEGIGMGGEPFISGAAGVGESAALGAGEISGLSGAVDYSTLGSAGPSYMGSSYSVPASSGASSFGMPYSTPAMNYASGALGGGSLLTGSGGPSMLESVVNTARDVWGNPVGKEVIKSGASSLIGSMQDKKAAKESQSFSDQIAALIRSATNNTYKAAQAAPLRPAGLKGSAGVAVDPASIGASMNLPAPVAPTSGAVPGTQPAPNAPAMSKQQGAVKLQPRMYGG